MFEAVEPPDVAEVADVIEPAPKPET